MIDRTQVVVDMPEDEYHADPVVGGSLSYSMAKVLDSPGGPAKLRWMLDHGREPRRDFDLGSAAHKVVLGVGAETRVIPEEILASNGAASTGPAKAFIAEAYADGAIPLKPAEAEQITMMAARLREHPEAAAILAMDGMQHEVSAFTQHPSGVWLRGRFDMICPTLVGDYKTAADADPHRFARKTMLDMSYHVQAAHYSDLAAAVGLTDGDVPFKFIVQEKKPPYLVSVVTVGAEYLALGREAMRRAIDMWATCQATGVWPGYPSVTAEPPAWALHDAYSVLDPTIEAELEALLNH